MSLSICVCDCSQKRKTSRFPCELKNVTGVGDLMNKIADQMKCTKDELDLFYCGEKLVNEKSLESYNITSRSTVYAFMKKSAQEMASGEADVPCAHEVLHTLQKALQNASYRKTVDHLLTGQDGAMQKMMSSVPGLASDPIALSMLQDPELLSILAHRHNIHKVLRAHPAFGRAALYIAAAVEEERSKDGSRPSRSAIYSLDQMSDEEDERNEGAAGGAQPITASQLAAALAAATASTSRPPVASSSSGTQQASSSDRPSMISPDFFQQAMLQAQNAALDAQVQQLRDMGITDENVARQALTQTGGDLQAALEFIFGNN